MKKFVFSVASRATGRLQIKPSGSGDENGGIFVSEPMTLPEIDHVSFFVEHVQTFFAGEVFEQPSAVGHAHSIGRCC